MREDQLFLSFRKKPDTKESKRVNFSAIFTLILSFCSIFFWGGGGAGLSGTWQWWWPVIRVQDGGQAMGEKISGEGERREREGGASDMVAKREGGARDMVAERGGRGHCQRGRTHSWSSMQGRERSNWRRTGRGEERKKGGQRGGGFNQNSAVLGATLKILSSVAHFINQSHIYRDMI